MELFVAYFKCVLDAAQPLLVPTMEGSGSGGSVSPTLAAPAEPPSLLGPGEIIKPSGKFPKPTKIPGKNYSKDEVVIRNADSGKGDDTFLPVIVKQSYLNGDLHVEYFASICQ